MKRRLIKLGGRKKSRHDNQLKVLNSDRFDKSQICSYRDFLEN